jgi:hypothetical protein
MRIGINHNSWKLFTFLTTTEMHAAPYWTTDIHFHFVDDKSRPVIGLAQAWYVVKPIMLNLESGWYYV